MKTARSWLAAWYNGFAETNELEKLLELVQQDAIASLTPASTSDGQKP